MEALGIRNEHEFSKALKYKRAENIYNATGGKRFPGIPLLIDVLMIFPEANIEYVLTGVGKVLKEKSIPEEMDKDVIIRLKASELLSIQSSLNKLQKVVPVPVLETPSAPTQQLGVSLTFVQGDKNQKRKIRPKDN